ncbi:hypothetical protein ACUNE0_11605 [Serratia sp. IR-2025]
MDNKLSELSKPVAEIRKHYPLGYDAPAGVFFQPLEGLSAVNFGDLLYSQEYVSALTQRIAELESANQSQDDHINQQQDRIESLEKTNTGLGQRLGAAEKRLATPVRLPRPGFVTCSGERHYTYGADEVRGAIHAAGFTVEGGE